MPAEGEYNCDYVNNLEINSFWKLLKASCVCVWLNSERVFSMLSFPVLMFISSAKRVRLQCLQCSSPAKTCSSAVWCRIWRWIADTNTSLATKAFVCNTSLAMNVFVCSVISYSDMSSRDYLVTSIECNHLQHDIVFVEVSSKDYLVASNKCVCLKCDIVFRGE